MLLVQLLTSLLLGASFNGPTTINPKVFIITMFTSELGAWTDIPEFNLFEQNITVPGFSPLFPDVHCTGDGSVCLLTTGEAEINAASTISSLLLSPSFNLTSTYFFITGIAGVNPKIGSIGDVTFAKYAVQVALQYEFDARQIPADFPTGYFPQDSLAPGQVPGHWYGTEVFEVNDALRQLAFDYAETATLNDTLAAQLARNLYANSTGYEAATQGPKVVLCDTATSDVYWSGDLLGEAFENTTQIFTNGSSVFCTSQQEDNATLSALMRGALFRLVDFARIIVMRTASDFDRQYSGESPLANLLGSHPGYEPSVLNLHLAGVKVVQGIVGEWDDKFAAGIQPTNYIGDVFGSLGGEPDFGPGSIFGGTGAVA
ncbi:purine nucleoside permease [Mycena maculata]|uniref:Purine nucleoside permease n=1 Tax=Mycena maculata TaxID=230809 RepID=A0AAD7IYS2_9AGAR|nr:purine nucleoside permease [Mycena maculata]